MSNRPQQHRNILGIDAGGTFTDFVLLDHAGLHIHKVLSTPDNPARAILQGIEEMGLTAAAKAGDLHIVHGSTVATNAALERKGVKTAYVANKGLKDVLTIGRQARTHLYDLNPTKQAPPVPAELCLEVDTRRDAQGNCITALTDADIDQLMQTLESLQPEAVAINLLYSFLNDEEEQRLEAALREHYFVSRSSTVLPVYKEYERGIATWLNASLGPKVNHYLQHLSAELPAQRITIMQSSGGTLPLAQASQRAVNLLLSGPAGGLAAMRYLGHCIQQARLISFDMGGTSTDVALMDGDFKLSTEGRIANWPVAVPMLEMDTIGAGGGSIAWLDEGGMLHVGPQSSGSDPGPACYGFGGTQATVTDANLVLGHLQESAFLGGNMRLHRDKAEQAILPLAQAQSMSVVEMAKGIITIAEQQMSQALHGISVKQGYDPRDFLLCCFGGAGGLHICALADRLDIKQAIVPVNGGVLSAFGMLCAPRQRFLTQTCMGIWRQMDRTQLNAAYDALEAPARQDLSSEGFSAPEICSERSVDLRFKGQSYTLSVPLEDDSLTRFYEVHKKIYGHTLDTDVELVNISARLYVETDAPSLDRLAPEPDAQPVSWSELPFEKSAVPIYRRTDLGLNARITGPALITETVSTTWIAPGWVAQVDMLGNLRLSRS